jgi:hypothetical protein
MTDQALGRAAAELRDLASLDELALVAGQTAWLLGVLRQAGERLGVPPPHQVMVGLQGLRLWMLAIKEAQIVVPARPW